MQGYTVNDEDDDDPVLLDQDGNHVETWRERHPYDCRMARDEYEHVMHPPTAGEMVLFDRSWYNRAGVEKVMGFCTPEQHAEFIRQAPMFEDMPVSEGLELTKFWFDEVVGDPDPPIVGRALED